MFEGLKIPIADAKKYYKNGQIMEALDCYELVIKSCYTETDPDDAFVENFCEAITNVIMIAKKVGYKGSDECQAIMDELLQNQAAAQVLDDPEKRKAKTLKIAIQTADQFVLHIAKIRNLYTEKDSDVTYYAIGAAAAVGAAFLAYHFLVRRK